MCKQNVRYSHIYNAGNTELAISCRVFYRVHSQTRTAFDGKKKGSHNI